MFVIKTPFNTIFNLVSLFLIYFFIFKLGFLKTFIVFPFSSIVFTLVGILLTNPYLSILSKIIQNSLNLSSHSKDQPKTSNITEKEM